MVSTGKLQQAEQFLREADELNRQMGNRKEMEFVLTAHGYLALAARDYDRAIDHCSENARLLNEVGNRMGYLIGWSDSNVESARPTIDQAGVDRVIQLIQERFWVAEYTDAYKKGRALGMNEVVGLALRNYGNL